MSWPLWDNEFDAAVRKVIDGVIAEKAEEIKGIREHVAHLESINKRQSDHESGLQAEIERLKGASAKDWEAGYREGYSKAFEDLFKNVSAHVPALLKQLREAAK